MIYKLLIRNDLGKQKEFYLTEDSKNKVIRRAITTYGVPKEAITIAAEFEETKNGYKLKAEYVKKMTKKEEKISQLASELYHSAVGKCDPYKTQYKEKYNMSEFTITTENDIIELLNKYKKVKVYWQTTEKRGQHLYYALVK